MIVKFFFNENIFEMFGDHSSVYVKQLRYFLLGQPDIFIGVQYLNVHPAVERTDR